MVSKVVFLQICENECWIKFFSSNTSYLWGENYLKLTKRLWIFGKLLNRIMNYFRCLTQSQYGLDQNSQEEKKPRKQRQSRVSLMVFQQPYSLESWLINNKNNMGSSKGGICKRWKDLRYASVELDEGIWTPKDEAVWDH